MDFGVLIDAQLVIGIALFELLPQLIVLPL